MGPELVSKPVLPPVARAWWCRCAARTFREQLKEDTAGGGAAPSQDQLDNVEHPEISRQRNLTLNGACRSCHTCTSRAVAARLAPA